MITFVTISAIDRLERALDANREILERIQPVDKIGDKKDDGDTFSSDLLPDGTKADPAG